MKPEEGMSHDEGKPLFIPKSMGMRGSRLQHPNAYNIGGKPRQVPDSRFDDRKIEEVFQRRIYVIF